MATSSGGGDGGGDQRRLLSIPKEGERIIAPTRRPDGTLRKAIRIRAGYVPQEEVAIYQSKGALMRKSGPDVPPGYDPELAVDAKPKTKAAKRNERRKEKRQQVGLPICSLLKAIHVGGTIGVDSIGFFIRSIFIFLSMLTGCVYLQASSTSDKGKSLDTEEAAAGETDKQRNSVDSVAKQISGMAISEPFVTATPSTNATENSQPESSAPDIDKKIRALKKKIRLAEAQLQGDPEKSKPETIEKMKKIEGWCEEFKLLEDKRAS
ncbi:hypothetical protein PR202_gb19310 [Eleusine coracana subsp. coracana]|uniref:WIBG Mago-binding domain-containing protein n=1 Tax=Eleusine coracana subsp. coracana TaxID=191504 RepID=A0AAV5F7B5_ELECO|nr:hypothetical protein PR202_gb19310 [Eleusine coracana subsp. coracana]